MNIDIGDAHILVVLYEVDGGCNLSQLCGILTEVGEDIALVEFEAQVSFTLSALTLMASAFGFT